MCWNCWSSVNGRLRGCVMTLSMPNLVMYQEKDMGQTMWLQMGTSGGRWSELPLRRIMTQWRIRSVHYFNFLMRASKNGSAFCIFLVLVLWTSPICVWLCFTHCGVMLFQAEWIISYLVNIEVFLVLSAIYRWCSFYFAISFVIGSHVILEPLYLCWCEFKTIKFWQT